MQSWTADAVEGTDALVLRLDCGGGVLDLNHAVERLTGWPIEELRGELLSATLVPAEYAEALANALDRLRLGDVRVRLECDVVARGGKRKRIAWSLARLPPVAGELQICAIGMDVSNWVAVAEEAREKADALRTVIDAAPYSMNVMDDQGRVVLANEAFFTENEISQERAVGKSAIELGIVSADLHEQLKTKLSKHKRLDLVELCLQRATGVEVHCLVSTR